jgi:RNA polymerase-binding protein DksA
MLTAHQRDAFQDKLHALRAELDDRASSLRDEALHSAGGENVGDLSHAPIHLADMGNQEAEAVVNLGLAENEAVLRKEIDEALGRLDAGTFGVCAQCKSAIDLGRLEAAPYSRLCIRCAERSQRQGRF